MPSSYIFARMNEWFIATKPTLNFEKTLNKFRNFNEQKSTEIYTYYHEQSFQKVKTTKFLSLKINNHLN
jgi:hypothetical protein